MGAAAKRQSGEVRVRDVGLEHPRPIAEVARNVDRQLSFLRRAMQRLPATEDETAR